jgi:hypothetical protein
VSTVAVFSIGEKDIEIVPNFSIKKKIPNPTQREKNTQRYGRIFRDSLRSYTGGTLLGKGASGNIRPYLWVFFSLCVGLGIFFNREIGYDFYIFFSN